MLLSGGTDDRSKDDSLHDRYAVQLNRSCVSFANDRSDEDGAITTDEMQLSSAVHVISSENDDNTTDEFCPTTSSPVIRSDFE